LLVWGYLGVQAMEMLAASARVIHHRTNRRNSPAQLFTMGSEKVEAALEASHAMTRHWLSMQDKGAYDDVGELAGADVGRDAPVPYPRPQQRKAHFPPLSARGALLRV
jgi:hypothetical protein